MRCESYSADPICARNEIKIQVGYSERGQKGKKIFFPPRIGGVAQTGREKASPRILKWNEKITGLSSPNRFIDLRKEDGAWLD